MSVTGKASRYPRTFGLPWVSEVPQQVPRVGLSAAAPLALERDPVLPVAANFTAQRGGNSATACQADWRVEGIAPSPVLPEHFQGGALPAGQVFFAAGLVEVPVSFLVSPGADPPSELAGRVVLENLVSCEFAAGRGELPFSIAAGVITTEAVVSLDVPFTTLDPGEGSPPEEFTRAFGPGAPWNRPVAGLAQHPDSATLASRLWSTGSVTGGDFNCTFSQYTYAVYEKDGSGGRPPASTTIQVSFTDHGHPTWGNVAEGTLVPWHPDWLPSGGFWAGSNNEDNWMLILDTDTGAELDLWQVALVGGKLQVGSANQIAGDYRTKEAPVPSDIGARGCGIQNLAFLVRAKEVATGTIQHALGMPTRAEAAPTAPVPFVAPAQKSDGSGTVSNPGIPSGTRFYLSMTNAELDTWIATLPSGLGATAIATARIIAQALRDYGWFISDHAGNAAHLQFEDYNSGDWAALGMQARTVSGKPYPESLLDGLMTQARLRAIVPSDQYLSVPTTMRLLLDNTPSSGKPYSSGEIATIATAHYGSYRVRMKPAKGSGLISSFFTYALSGNAEIDVEFLGKNPTQVEFNYYNNGVGDHETVYDLGYDASLDFHEYGFDWAPGSITWFVDGVAVHTETGTRGPLPTEAGPLMINLWAVNTSGASWAGTFTYTGPVQADYDSISYVGSTSLSENFDTFNSSVWVKSDNRANGGAFNVGWRADHAQIVTP